MRTIRILLPLLLPFGLVLCGYPVIDITAFRPAKPAAALTRTPVAAVAAPTTPADCN